MYRQAFLDLNVLNAVVGQMIYYYTHEMQKWKEDQQIYICLPVMMQIILQSTAVDKRLRWSRGYNLQLFQFDYNKFTGCRLAAKSSVIKVCCLLPHALTVAALAKQWSNIFFQLQQSYLTRAAVFTAFLPLSLLKQEVTV